MDSLKDQKNWKATLEEGEYVIRGKRGLISQYSDGNLNVWILNTRIATKASMVWKSLHTYDDGADFKIDFNLRDLDKACKFIQAKKKRHLSPEARQTLIARLSKTGYKKRDPAINSISSKESGGSV